MHVVCVDASPQQHPMRSCPSKKMGQAGCILSRTLILTTKRPKIGACIHVLQCCSEWIAVARAYKCGHIHLGWCACVGPQMVLKNLQDILSRRPINVGARSSSRHCVWILESYEKSIDSVGSASNVTSSRHPGYHLHFPVSGYCAEQQQQSDRKFTNSRGVSRPG